MRVADLSPSALHRHLRGDGLDLSLGPFQVRLRSPFPEMSNWLAKLYAGHPVRPREFADFHVSVEAPRGLRRFLKPQTVFSADGVQPFHPLPRAHAGPSFEWGLNWCIATRAHRYLIFHAAVLERDGQAVLLPGEPGAGKSTLCAGLAMSGWRLLTDELGLLDPGTGLLHGIARPVNLKNRSIEVIRERFPEAVLSDVCHDTAKGSVALMAPPGESVRRVAEPVRPRWVITPEYAAGATARLEPHSRATSFMELAHNSFNYSILGTAGFEALGSLIDVCDCYHFRYASLDDARDTFEALVRNG